MIGYKSSGAATSPGCSPSEYQHFNKYKVTAFRLHFSKNENYCQFRQEGNARLTTRYAISERGLG